MNFKGEEAISRATRLSGRALLVVSLTLFVFKLGWIETADTSVVGLRFAENKFDLAVSWLVVLLIVAHLVQWNSDRLSFSSWNILGRKLAAVRVSGSTNQRLDDVVVAVEQAIKFLEDTEFNRADTSLSKVLEELRTLNGRLRDFGFYSVFYVFVWHMIVPVGVAAIALVWRAQGG